MSAFGVFQNRFRQDIPFAVDNHIRFRVPSPFSFSKSQMEDGDKLFKAIGIAERDWYVTFHSRDNAFDNQISGSNETYNRMASYRNSDIYKYQGAVSQVIKSGGKAFRVGFPVESAVKFVDNSLYDYSLSKFRSDFADVWVCANSRFMVTTANGIAEIPEMFDVPIIMVNTVPIGAYPLGVNSLYLPKILANKKGQPLPFSEQLRYFSKVEIAANRFVLDDIHSDGLMLIDNSEQQLTSITQEMLRRLSGQWIPKNGYYDRLGALNECYQKFGGHGAPLSPMGEDFLFELAL
jgi:putative glycosyltransferase (TIGR04372 family)